MPIKKIAIIWKNIFSSKILQKQNSELSSSGVQDIDYLIAHDRSSGIAGINAIFSGLYYSSVKLEIACFKSKLPCFSSDFDYLH